MADAALTLQWAVCGIAAAGARFVPVPLLDDVIRQQAARLAVLRTVREHGVGHPAELFEPLWDDDAGRGGSRGGAWRRRVRHAGTRLLLFPVRKYTAVFGSVRGVPTDVMRVVLLARSVDRVLARGGLATVPELPQQARALRTAVDEAVARMDLRMLVAALGDALSQTRGLSSAAVALARRRVADAEPKGDLQPGAPVSEGAEHVTQALRRPEVQQLLERFDEQVDLRLAAPSGGRTGT